MIRVLIVDDEPLIAQAHRSYVERVPEFVVHGVVHSGNAAVRAVTAANATDQPIDLVLLDIGLPDASGLDVASALGGLRPSPDIIAVTSARDLEVVRSAVARGIVLYLLKPFTFAAFRDKLERYLEYRAALPAGESAVSQHDIDARCPRYERPTIEQRHRKALRLKHSDSSQRPSGILRDP